MSERVCKSCSGPVSRYNRSGYCAACANSSPEKRAKISASMKRVYAADPALRETRRRIGRETAARPGEKERRAAQCRATRMWEKGLAGRTPESVAKIARATSERRMAWCPPELRDHARWLVKTKHMRLAEVQPLILEMHEAEMRRFRRSIGGA